MGANYVTLAAPNSIMAKAFIIDNMYKSDIQNLSLSPYTLRQAPDHLVKVVDQFMAKHPRGKDTTGSIILRELYIACWTLKVAQSRPRYRHDDGMVNIRAAYHAALKDSPIFRFDASGKNLTGSQRGITNMVLKNEASGYEGGDLWLTDFGMKVRDMAVRVKTAKDAREKAADLKKYGPALVELHQQLLAGATDEETRQMHQLAINTFGAF